MPHCAGAATALRSVADRLLAVAYAMLTRQATFNPELSRQSRIPRQVGAA
jgi:hypothetical protein